jgi:hypothetical protein
MRSTVVLAMTAGLVATGRASPSCPTPPPRAAVVADSAPLQARVEAEQLRALERVIGQYARGDAVVYRGTIRAARDRVTVEGSVIARLVVGSCGTDIDGYVLTRWAGNTSHDPLKGRDACAVLVSRELKSGLKLGITQVADVTATGPLASDYTATDVDSTCTQCAPTLSDRLPHLDLRLTTRSDRDPAKDTVVSLALDAVDACTLTLDDLAAAQEIDWTRWPQSSVTATAHPSKTELVWHVTGEMALGGGCPGRPADSPIPCRALSSQGYAVDVYVSRVHIAHYGVRNFAAGIVHTTLTPRRPEMTRCRR